MEKDPTPFLRGIVAELGFEGRKFRTASHGAVRERHIIIGTAYMDAAMLSFTSYTKVGLRIATFFGFLASGISFIIALVYLIMKLVFWERFIAGAALMVILTCFLGGIQLFFIGLVGEYIMNMNARIMNRPLVIEEKRLNFENDR